MTYKIDTKVTWHQTVEKSWEESFYPSLTKKIRKSDEYFSSIFEFKVTQLEDINSADFFFDLYEREIASRDNYIYKKSEQHQTLQRNIEKGIPYFVGGIYKKENDEFAGGTIFSKRENKFSTALRAFNSSIRSAFRSQTTIDFWAEKKFYEFAKKEMIQTITHGTDNYPNIGRVGLPLFKLKIGGKPKIAKKEHEVISISDEELLKKENPILFWGTPDEDNFFKTCHLFYKEEKIDESVLGELKKVLEWTGIKLEING